MKQTQSILRAIIIAILAFVAFFANAQSTITQSDAQSDCNSLATITNEQVSLWDAVKTSTLF